MGRRDRGRQGSGGGVSAGKAGARTATDLAWPADGGLMAKGYPVRQESAVLPECQVCGSGRFREDPLGLRCEDCGIRLRDPFR